jgi:hypothetical protein
LIPDGSAYDLELELKKWLLNSLENHSQPTHQYDKKIC